MLSLVSPRERDVLDQRPFCLFVTWLSETFTPWTMSFRGMLLRLRRSTYGHGMKERFFYQGSLRDTGYETHRLPNKWYVFTKVPWSEFRLPWSQPRTRPSSGCTSKGRSCDVVRFGEKAFNILSLLPSIPSSPSHKLQFSKQTETESGNDQCYVPDWPYIVGILRNFLGHRNPFNYKFRSRTVDMLTTSIMKGVY